MSTSSVSDVCAGGIAYALASVVLILPVLAVSGPAALLVLPVLAISRPPVPQYSRSTNGVILGPSLSHCNAVRKVKSEDCTPASDRPLSHKKKKKNAISILDIASGYSSPAYSGNNISYR